MPAVIVSLRDALVAALNAGLASTEFPAATVAAAYLPSERLNDPQLAVRPVVKVIAAAFDERRVLREPAWELELPLQVAVQMKLTSPSSVSEMDKLVHFIEQIGDLTHTDTLLTTPACHWLRNEALKDPNGLPYSYEALLSSGVFQGIFTVFYKTNRR